MERLGAAESGWLARVDGFVLALFDDREVYVEAVDRVSYHRAVHVVVLLFMFDKVLLCCGGSWIEEGIICLGVRVGEEVKFHFVLVELVVLVGVVPRAVTDFIGVVVLAAGLGHSYGKALIKAVPHGDSSPGV